MSTTYPLLFFEPKLCIKTYKFSRALSRMGYRIEMAYSVGTFGLNYELDASHVKKYHKVGNVGDLVRLIRGGKYKYVICKDINSFVVQLVLQKINPILLIGDIQSARTSQKKLVPLEKTVFSHINPGRVIFSGTFIRAKVASLFGKKFLNSPVVPNVPTNESFKTLAKLSKAGGGKSSDVGMIHLVYCGCLQNNAGHRNFNNLFGKILASSPKIVLHVIPTKYKEGINHLKMKNHSRLRIHPTIPYQKLHQYLTQFDIGLCLFDMSYQDREYIHISEANKFYDYLFAGLPQVTNQSRSYQYLTQKYQCGECLVTVGSDFEIKMKKLKALPIKFEISKEGLDARLAQLALFRKKSLEV